MCYIHILFLRASRGSNVKLDRKEYRTGLAKEGISYEEQGISGRKQGVVWELDMFKQLHGDIPFIGTSALFT